MNIYDISKKAGVSTATVSRVLNGNERVSESTRQKVLQVIQETNFTPNPFARGLGLDTMRTVGILYSDVSDMYLASAVSHLEQKLREHEYDSLLCCTGYQHKTRQKYVELLLSKRVDAIILAGSYYVEEVDSRNDYIRAAARRVPVAILNGYVPGDNIYCVTCDDVRATNELATLLLKSGSRNILYLFHSHSDSTRRKLIGLRQAHESLGRPFDEGYVLNCPLRDIDQVAKFIESIPKEVTFDTVMASDDALAAGALKYARLHGISVPSQLRVAGYDDSVLAKCCAPELTTVDNKMETLCMVIVDTLIHRLAGSKISSMITIRGDVIQRASTGACVS